ncbi:oligosaccharide flippase family protein [Enterococcus hulanensis]|uniref:Oligosaccharide flippase family protein n=1 Tax=Enterococcus hulanensis TaxID=2559929 RepID=A0ABU3F572_9ENTE|nr:oligosaccharide flippase family protein [Enterococcus hulanensis]MDT2602292.1 oligosaccharide flippase family protein [Enterococcus hulanensis]MDT2611687.1 oligosaccharide flippase family protein [Enterococcus hulanensis]MDT2618915.1 oligosaccharide flippase family protein [Enterococcus hulanensis]MDT2630364.1 oligosaccharide flippase family protein [Enterococcus hulanensis]MDT2657850.1 oligosaccharide flippase family protein [Enterococcus hulanensis]
MNRYKKLITNSLIFSIGNFGSKLITFFLVPLYTFYLTTSQYGEVDLVTTTVNLLLPIFSFALTDAVVRFVLDSNYNNKKVISTVFGVLMFSSVLLIILTPIIRLITVVEHYYIYFIVILVLQIFQSVLSQYLRAINKIKQYAINSIVLTTVICGSNVILLVFFKLGIDGYFISQILGCLSSIAFLIFVSKVHKQIGISYFDKSLSIEMLKFSIPLIPTYVLWWLVNGASRYFIAFFIGATANGLFAVASKIPSLLNMLSNIFMQSWQISAIEEDNSKDKSIFYSKVFNLYIRLLFLCISGMLVFLRPVMSVIVDVTFYDSWKLIPFLLIAAVYSAISGFLGQIYVVAKRTNGMLKTSLFPGIISVLANLIFIPFIGIIGASIAQMLGWGVAVIYRIIDTRKYLKFSIDLKYLTIVHLIVFIQIFSLNAGENLFLTVVNSLLFMVMFVLNLKLMKDMLPNIFPKK